MSVWPVQECAWLLESRVAAAVPATGVAASVGGGDGISDEIGLRGVQRRCSGPFVVRAPSPVR